MDVLKLEDRKRIIDEIESRENVARKEEHFKRQQIYSDQQRQYVLQELNREFPNSSSSMRTCTSINLTKRIVNEMASLYKTAPQRTYTDLNDLQKEQLDILYAESKANVKLKAANQKYKLHEQCAIQVLPKNGKLCIRVLAPHQYDVVPMQDNPDEAYAYILSNFDKSLLESTMQSYTDIQGYTNSGGKNEQQVDSVNQSIADKDDWRTRRVYAFWTKEHNFLCNGSGEIISDKEMIENPIKELPFIDVAGEKDFEFWIRRGSGVTEFQIDFSTVLSDTVNTNRLQSYAQPVISAENLPEGVKVGPNNILFLKLNPDRPEIKPSFEFATPNPDMQASLELQDRLLNYFLTSNGIDPKTVSGNGQGQKYTSGYERLLSMIDKFEASQDDIDLFKHVECELLELFTLWNNTLKGTDAILPEYQIAQLPEDPELEVCFAKPQVQQSASELEDSVIKKMEARLISRVEAIMELRGVNKEQAQEILKEIDQEDLSMNKNNFDTQQTTEA